MDEDEKKNAFQKLEYKLAGLDENKPALKEAGLQEETPVCLLSSRAWPCIIFAFTVLSLSFS